MKLHELIERYIAFRRALGDRFLSAARCLRGFARAVGLRATVRAVRRTQVDAFLAGDGPITSAWHVKHTTLLGFYRYAIGRGHVAEAPLPTVLPKRPPAFVPYLYTDAEVRGLLRAAESYRPRYTNLEPVTARTVVLSLYATGLRVHEAIALDRRDVDLANSLLTVRHTKFHKSRLVPFGAQLREVLMDYSARRPAVTGGAEEPAPFFRMRSGTRLVRVTLEARFRRVCERAGVRRSDGARYQPRLHDLRHTFAVNRLASWYRQGADVQRLLPQLAVYLGHTCLDSTQVYLSMTPELLADANGRFERYAGKEGSRD